VLHCVAVRGGLVQYVAVWISVLQSVAVCCSLLQSVAACIEHNMIHRPIGRQQKKGQMRQKT